MYQQQFQTSEWRPGGIFYSLWFIVAFVTTMTALFVIQGNIVSFPDSVLDWLIIAVAMLAWLALVPLLQYLLISRTNEDRRGLVKLVVPREVSTFFFLTTASRLEKSTFAFAMIVPIVVAWLGMPLLVVLTPPSSHSVMFAVIVGLTIGIAAKDFWYLTMALSKPEGTLVEDLESAGVRFHEPVATTAE